MTPAIPLARGLPVWIRIAALSFGGPAGQIAVMHRILVEERKWIREEQFLRAMSFCMLLPGPEAQQLATYLGWILHGPRGGVVAGTLFVLPGFLAILLLSILYGHYRESTILAGLLFGLRPAVIAIVVEALLRVGKRALRSSVDFALAAGAFVAVFFLQVSFPIVVAGAALVGYAMRGRSRSADGDAPADSPLPPPSSSATIATAVTCLLLWAVPVALLARAFGGHSVFVTEAVFFGKVALVTFGGAYAVLAYVAQQAVEVYRWVTPAEMLDGLSLAETTPGPLIQVVQFVAYLGAYRQPGELHPIAAGLLGSVVTTWVTYVPCFLFVLVGAPFAERLRHRRGLQSALHGVTAAVVGVILSLGAWFALHTLFGAVSVHAAGPLRVLSPDPATLDRAALAIAAIAAVATLRFRVGMLPMLAGAALLGLFVAAIRG